MLLAAEEPTTYCEATTEMMWQEAMQKELEAIEKNKTRGEGNVIKHKVKLVAKRYVQRQGVDFEEVFTPMARLDTVSLILALASQHGWEVHHLDVKSTFLDGDL